MPKFNQLVWSWNVMSNMKKKGRKTDKEYKKECEHSGPMYGRNDSVAQQSAAKLVELLNQYLK